MHARRWRTPALVALLVVGLLVAGSGWLATVPLGLSSVATGVGLQRDPDNAIRGSVTITTQQPSIVVVTATAPGHSLQVASTSATIDHHVPLLGLLEDTDYEVAVDILDDGGGIVAQADLGTLETLPLPAASLPPITVDVAELERMTPGLTLFNSIYRDPVVGEPNPFNGYLQVIDETGRIRWYHNEPGRVQQAVQLDDGSFLYGTDEDAVKLVSPMGDMLGEWRGYATGSEPGAEGFGAPDTGVVELDVHSIHHETLPALDGMLVGLSREVRPVTYPDGLCDDSEPGDVENIVGDSVVVWDPATGEVVQELSFFDAQDVRDDPRPVESDYCAAGYLDPQYPEGFQPRDWTHANAVVPMDDGATWLVSNRHTDSLWALRAVADEGGPAGSLRWELGRDNGWELVGEGRWFFHQHAPEVQDDGTILLYDNGNMRDDADQPYSRAVRYRIDPEARTVEQVWEHRMEPDVYASFVGDADRLDGTVLITHGGQLETCEHPESDDDTFIVGQLVEVEEETGDIVWQVTTRDDATCQGWGIYRAERIDSLYPPQWDVTETMG